ncbi:hypothetical protein [Bacillus tuaregi]|uniref:hypothetical protein n=1 Tax=Bacillus tuaregi TaxID=1816695 RepID=UPI0008F90A1C|nr:hypothetical protein [Bacillus tuaregi]
MRLIYSDLVQLFPNYRGVSDLSLSFLTVTSFAHLAQPKGIFIPLFKTSGELKEAINNGAIAVLWDEEVPLPAYTPNQFLVFYCKDLLKGLKEMIEYYQKKLESEQKSMKQTKFHLLPELSLNVKQDTYDVAVMGKLEQLLKDSHVGRGE